MTSDPLHRWDSEKGGPYIISYLHGINRWQRRCNQICWPGVEINAGCSAGTPAKLGGPLVSKLRPSKMTSRSSNPTAIIWWLSSVSSASSASSAAAAATTNMMQVCVIIPFPSSITRRTMVFPPILWPLRFQSLSSWASAWPRPWCAPDWSWDADPGAQHRGTIRRMRDGYGYQAVPEVLLQQSPTWQWNIIEKMACPGNIGICQCQVARGHLYLASGYVISMTSMISKSNDDNDGLPNASANSVMGNRAAARAQYLGHSRADAGSPEAFSRGKSWHRFFDGKVTTAYL